MRLLPSQQLKLCRARGSARRLAGLKRPFRCYPESGPAVDKRKEYLGRRIQTVMEARERSSRAGRSTQTKAEALPFSAWHLAGLNRPVRGYPGRLVGPGKEYPGRNTKDELKGLNDCKRSTRKTPCSINVRHIQHFTSIQHKMYLTNHYLMLSGSTKNFIAGI